MLIDGFILEKILLEASDDALWKHYTSCSEEARVMDRTFWKRRFIQEFGREKGEILSSHPYPDLGRYYFHKKYHNYRGNLLHLLPQIFCANDAAMNAIDVHSVRDVINSEYYWHTSFKITARVKNDHLYVRIKPRTEDTRQTRQTVEITLRNNGNYSIVGCQTQNEIDELVYLLTKSISSS